jgi:hypothetical protein
MSNSRSQSTRARPVLVTCQACECHVRSNETVCPHCAADLALPMARRTGAAGWRDARRDARRLLAAAALAGVGTACGGAVADPSATQAASESDIMGTCATGGQSASCNVRGCTCGPAGSCTSNGCIPISCEDKEYLNKDGECVSIYWFEGRMPTSSACYGCPPPRTGRQNVRAT